MFSSVLPRSIPALLNSRRLRIAVLIAISFLYWGALYFYVPTLPTYVESKVSDLALVGTVLSMYGLWQAILRLPLGIAADWVGRRKPFILAGLALAGFGAWIMGAAGGATGLTIGRAVTGLAAATWVPLVVVFTALFRPEEAILASSILTFSSSLGRMIASSLNGTLIAWGSYTTAFSVAAAVAGAAVLLTMLIREPRQPSLRRSWAEIGRLVVRRDVLLPALLAAVSQYGAWATSFGFVPVLAQSLGAADVSLSLLATMNLGFYTAGNLAATGLASRVSPRRVVVACFVLLGASAAGFVVAPSLAWLFVAQAGVGLATGAAYPVLMGSSIRFVSDSERATAMGLHQAVYAVGMFAGPWLSGILADAFQLRPMFGITAAICLALGLFGSRFLPAHR